MEQTQAIQSMEDFRRKFERHARRIGILVSHFHTLEGSVRSRLQVMPRARPMGIMAYQDISQYKVGTRLPETEITCYESLRELIRRYNREARKHAYPELDITLVDLRDALAHGRICGTAEERRLIHFSKVQNGMVRVVFNEAISEEWYERQDSRIVKAQVELIKTRRWK